MAVEAESVMYSVVPKQSVPGGTMILIERNLA